MTTIGGTTSALHCKSYSAVCLLARRDPSLSARRRERLEERLPEERIIARGGGCRTRATDLSAMIDQDDLDEAPGDGAGGGRGANRGSRNCGSDIPELEAEIVYSRRP